MFFDQHVYANVYEPGSCHTDQTQKRDIELLKWLERNITDQKYRELYLATYSQMEKESFYRM